jgi:hypothetical protein
VQNPKIRATFLIVATGVMVFHLSVLRIFVLLVGYWISAEIDQWLTKRQRKRAIDEVVENETVGWEPDPNQAECEERDGFSRIKLSAKEQIVVGRIVHFLWRIESARM